MKKWTWILLALSVGVILFLWTIREKFQDTATLRGPPYGDSDYPTIANLMSPELVTKLQDKYVSENPGQNRPDKTMLEGQRKLVDGAISSLMGDFHITVYQPATTPLTEANVDTFLGTKATAGFLLENKAEIKKLLVAYFVNQTAGAANAGLTASQEASNARSANSGYANLLKDLGQTSTYTDPSQPKCPPGLPLDSNDGRCGKPDVNASITCPEGSEMFGGTTCIPPSSITSHSEKIALGFTYSAATNFYSKPRTITCPAGYKTKETDSEKCEDVQKQDPTCSGEYTFEPPTGKCVKPGDQSNTGSYGSTNIFNKGNIWGPAYTGMGDNAGGGLDGGTSRDYPTLIGPKPNLSKMVESGAIAPVSQSDSLVKSGILPDPKSTGSDPNSQFFGSARNPAGSSRTPGDKDLFPNPYQEFTPSTGSSKTEPVPYLSDFSAFLN
jgi:hypothetical protein